MTILKTPKSRSIVTAPLDDVDTNNPEFDSHHGGNFCKRVRRGVRSTARHYGAESWESREAFVYPFTTNYHNTLIYDLSVGANYWELFPIGPQFFCMIQPELG